MQLYLKQTIKIKLVIKLQENYLLTVIYCKYYDLPIPFYYKCLFNNLLSILCSFTHKNIDYYFPNEKQVCSLRLGLHTTLTN